MTLNGSDIDIFEGVVIENKDAKGLGRIKCCIASEMDSTVTSQAILPWIRPLFGDNGFSVPQKGAKVWVFKNTQALDDYRYWPMPNMSTSVNNYIKENNDENTKVIMANDNGYCCSSLTHDDKSGFNMNTGVDASFNLNPSGKFTLKSGTTLLEGNNNHYKIGQHASEQAVLGNKLSDILKDIAVGLKDLSITASSNPYTTSLAQPLLELSDNINEKVDDILSQHITIE